MVAIRIEEVQPVAEHAVCKRCGWADRCSGQVGICGLCMDILSGQVFSVGGLASEDVTEARRRLRYHRDCLAAAQTRRGRIYHLTAIALEESIINGHEETLQHAAEADGFADWCDMVDAYAVESGRYLVTAAGGR